MNPRLRLAVIATTGTVGVLGLSAVGVRAAHSGAILPGITAAGIDLGGLTPEAAHEALEGVSQARADATIEVSYEGQTTTLTGADFGYALDHEATVDDAFNIGREGNFFATTWRHVSATFGRSETVEVIDVHDEALLDQQLEAIAATIDQDAGIGDLVGDSTQLTVTAVAPARGLVVDREATVALLLAAAASDGPDELTVPVAVQEPTVSLEAVEAAAARAQQAIGDGLTLFAGDLEVVLTPAQLAGMVTVRADGDGDVQLDARSIEVERAFNQTAGQFEVEAVDATFTVERDPGVVVDGKGAVTWEPQSVNIPITRSTPGRTFDSALTARQIGDLLERGETRAQIALREVQANFTIEDAEALGIDQLLGTFTTYHACCQTRVRNIQKLADLVDGRVVLPGDQFSINQISGVRTCASGFFPAGMILNGEIVDSCGGGVSQFGTTTFNAAFFAGLQLDAWKAHSFYISRYPMGREATLNYPSPDIDVKFTNDTGHGLLVKTFHTSTSITVAIYGHSDVTKVEATRSGTFSPRNYSTERRANPALAPGAERRIQSGAPGFSVKVNRFITRKDGSVTEDEIATTYVPEKEIIEYGPGEPAPSPSPSPTPAPSPQPTPTPTPSSSPAPEPEPSPSESGN